MSVYEELTESQQFASRVIADHARATAFAIADGILPGNEGRNYVLRKIMRRAIYHGREHLGLTDTFFYKVCDFVVSEMNGAYPELETHREFIGKMVRIEEMRFENTVTVGLGRLNQLGLSQSTPKDDDLFLSIGKLYDTFGTPRDLIRVYLEEKGLGFDEDEFNERFDAALQELQKQSGIGKTERKPQANPLYQEIRSEIPPVIFVGYDETEIEDAFIRRLIKDNQEVGELLEGEEGGLVLNTTPFYAEAGGQVGDTGTMWTNRGAVLKVLDTFAPLDGLIIHKVRVEKGKVSATYLGEHEEYGGDDVEQWATESQTGVLDLFENRDIVKATVDAEKRDATRRNHTATHLVHAALREVLGTHVKQAGSVVAPNYLRFDFTHYQPMTDAEIAEVEDLVNRHILENHPVNTNIMAIEEAMRGGAMALFGEKYGADVRVLSVGDGVFSKELCGGTHVRSTGDIGSFKITSDEAIASGVRRIRAITGFDTFERFREDEKLIDASLGALNTQRDNLPNAIAKLQEELKKTRKEMDELKLKMALGEQGAASGEQDEPREIAGVKVLAKLVEGLDANGTRQLSDTLLARLKSGVVIIGRAEMGKVGLIVRVSDDLTGKVRAGDIIREIAPIVGGRGGGKAEMAEGGGTEPGKLAEAIDASYGVIERMLG